jgi:2-polyprenyl-3-methyl-5-hydroxy-6-metoxy-1,4-benzoquinol methylase
MNEQRRICFDLDSVICTHGQYYDAEPIKHRVDRIKELYESGAYIIIDTARGSMTGCDWLEVTDQQLRRWGVPFHELHVGRKPFAHVYVDDRASHDTEFFGDQIHDRWPDSYFDTRHGNDPRRAQAFAQELGFLVKHGVYTSGVVCDVGCSTGELLDALQWSGPRHGMEVSAIARAEAKARGVDFTRTIVTEQDYFDTVIFRGTLQHIPEPFRALQQAHKALHPRGNLVVLATPNTDSYCYRVLGKFPPPLSDYARNFWMPSARTLTNALVNLGFEIVAVEFPYWGGPYARPLHDLVSLARAVLTGTTVSFSWPGNMMQVIARKK